MKKPGLKAETPSGMTFEFQLKCSESTNRDLDLTNATMFPVADFMFVQNKFFSPTS